MIYKKLQPRTSPVNIQPLKRKELTDVTEEVQLQKLRGQQGYIYSLEGSKMVNKVNNGIYREFRVRA